MTAVDLPLSIEAKRMLVETSLSALRRGKRLRLSPGAALQLLRQERQRQQTNLSRGDSALTTATITVPEQRRAARKSEIIDELLEIHKDGWHLTRSDLEKMLKPRLARMLEVAKRHCR